MALEVPRHKFTTAEYHEMGRAGIFSEDDRVELIDGEVIEMSPINRPHAAVVRRADYHLGRWLGEAALLSIQSPIVLGDYGEPQPDLVALRPRSDFYAAAHPIPDDIFLVIEVADSSLQFDRQVKIPLYARHSIPETWLISLNDLTITVYRDPSPEGYQTIRVARRGELLAPLAFPEVSLPVEDLLG